MQRSLLRGDGASARSPGLRPLLPHPGLPLTLAPRGVGAAPPPPGEGYKKQKCINLHVLPQTPWGLQVPTGSMRLDPHDSSQAEGHRSWSLGRLGGGPQAAPSPLPQAADTRHLFSGFGRFGGSALAQGAAGGVPQAPRVRRVCAPQPEQGRGTLCCSSGGAPQPEWGQCDPLQGEPQGKEGTGLPQTRTGGAPGVSQWWWGARLAPLQGTGGEIRDGFRPTGIKAGVQPPHLVLGGLELPLWSRRGSPPPWGSPPGAAIPSPGKALVGQEGGGPSAFPGWFLEGWKGGRRGAGATYASSPMRVTLAERKVCRMKTMGLGQECRSSAWGGGKRDSGVSPTTAHQPPQGAAWAGGSQLPVPCTMLQG